MSALAGTSWEKIKAAGSEVHSEFIFMEEVGKLIDCLPLCSVKSEKARSEESMQLQPVSPLVQRKWRGFSCALKVPKWINSKGIG